eukprot:12659493-Alexandrium_andersonii.AAC.1
MSSHWGRPNAREDCWCGPLPRPFRGGLPHLQRPPSSSPQSVQLAVALGGRWRATRHWDVGTIVASWRPR